MSMTAIVFFIFSLNFAWVAKYRRDLSNAHKEIELLKIDPITGLYRRSVRSEEEIRNHILEACRNNMACVVMILDLDNLKATNDSLGHAAGDKLLSIAAKSMRTCLRPYDLIYRWGGDEFLIVISFDPKGRNPLSAAYKLTDRIDKSFGSRVSVSIGCAEVKDCDFLAAVEAADAAMYKQKQRSKKKL